MNAERPTATELFRWTTIAIIVLVALPFVLYAVVQFVPGAGGYVVLSDSMAPTYHAGDVVFTQSVPAEEVQEGDVITYHAPNSRQHVTHQVIEVVEQDGTRLFQTKGTANEEADPYLVPPGALIGVVVFDIPYLGHATTFLQTDLGIALFVIVPLSLLIVSEAWNLYTAARRGGGSTGSEPRSTDSGEESTGVGADRTANETPRGDRQKP